MTPEVRLFAENATLMFVASRSIDGTLDVSPRGGQPSVVAVHEDRLLLPDYQGNRRLDTIGNLLSQSHMALAILNRGTDRFLQIWAEAKVSTDPADIAAFPADDNAPHVVISITPIDWRFVDCSAFRKSGLWEAAKHRKPPLDLSAIVGKDRSAQFDAGFVPVRKSEAEEEVLRQHGIRAIYGESSESVKTKIFEVAGPGGMEFMGEAQFVVLAHDTDEGRFQIDFAGTAPIEVVPQSNRQTLMMDLPHDMHDLRGEGECAIVAIAPGRSEILRINGQLEMDDWPATPVAGVAAPATARIAPHEIFFHCPASLNRARIWQSDKRIPWAGRRKFKCTARIQETPEVVSFILSPCDRAGVGAIAPGQYVTVSLAKPGGGTLQRSYSVSRRTNGESLRISVRLTVPDGMSAALHGSLHPGREVEVSIPAGNFVLQSPPGRRVALISAGVGATPMLPMLEALAGEQDPREVWYIHGAKDRAHHLFYDEVAVVAGAAKGTRIHLRTVYSRPERDDRHDMQGRIEAAAIEEMMPVADTDFYICGPDAFMHSLRDGLVARGANPDAVRFETFAAGAGGLSLDGVETVAKADIGFAKSNKTLTWTPDAGSILDLALSAGLDLPFSCRTGDCQSCVQRVLEGGVSYPGGEVPVLAQRQVLLCQAVPKGNLVLDC